MANEPNINGLLRELPPAPCLLDARARGSWARVMFYQTLVASSYDHSLLSDTSVPFKGTMRAGDTWS